MTEDFYIYKTIASTITPHAKEWAFKDYFAEIEEIMLDF